jgi:hypothetical protein
MSSLKIKALVLISALLGSALGGSQVDFSQHLWKAPGPNDLRGPCPGLNTYVSFASSA